MRLGATIAVGLATSAIWTYAVKPMLDNPPSSRRSGSQSNPLRTVSNDVRNRYFRSV